jgi:hypothetical protein
LWRAGLKDDAIEDLCKCLFYVQDEINRRRQELENSSRSVTQQDSP